MTLSQKTTQWQYLEERPHPWRKQLYIKGRKLKAFTLRANMIANNMTPQQAADNWDLPLAAIYEVIEYCNTHQDLLKQEAIEELHRLEHKEVNFESQTIG